jgi:hypothetical protein
MGVALTCIKQTPMISGQNPGENGVSGAAFDAATSYQLRDNKSPAEAAGRVPNDPSILGAFGQIK